MKDTTFNSKENCKETVSWMHVCFRYKPLLNSSQHFTVIFNTIKNHFQIWEKTEHPLLIICRGQETLCGKLRGFGFFFKSWVSLQSFEFFPLSTEVQSRVISSRDWTSQKKVLLAQRAAVEEFLSAFFPNADSKYCGALAACFWLRWICSVQLNSAFIFKMN